MEQEPVRQRARELVVVAVLDATNKVLVLSEPDNERHRFWLLPGGKVLENETPAVAMARIAKSRLGIKMQPELIARISSTSKGVSQAMQLFLAVIPDVLEKVRLSRGKLAETRLVEHLIYANDFLPQHAMLLSAALRL